MSIKVPKLCSICTETVIPYRRDPPPDKVCSPCKTQWAGQEDELWYRAAIEEQDKVHRLNVQSYLRETPLSRAEDTPKE